MTEENISQPATEDFLEADDAIRGQNYACLSFVSPEDVLKSKELFFMQKFLSNLVTEKNIDLEQSYIDDLEDKYKDFIYSRNKDFENEFYEKNSFRTSIRGIKVRGVYDTLPEAQNRAKKLQRQDKNFHVYVGQVGYWLPWDPKPQNVDKEEFYESELNDLVKKYRENQESKDEHFRENVEYAKDQATKKNEQTLLESKGSDGVVDIPATVGNLEDTLQDDDPWIKNKTKGINDTNNDNTV